MRAMNILMFREFIAHPRDLSVLSCGNRSLCVVIVARANCEPLDKHLLLCHFLNRRRPKIFGRNVLLSFHKRLVFNVLQVSVVHILDYIKFSFLVPIHFIWQLTYQENSCWVILCLILTIFLIV